MAQGTVELTTRAAADVADDPIIRSALRDHIGRQWPDAHIIEELGLNGVRVDLVAVDDKLRGFEIKSDRDSLRRLPLQIEVYSEILEEVTIVTGQRHLAAVMAIVPAWWAVWHADTSGDGLVLTSLRDASPNPGVLARSAVQLLWRDEVAGLLEAIGMLDGVRTKPRSILWERLAAAIDCAELMNHVRTALTSRTSWPARERNSAHYFMV